MTVAERHKLLVVDDELFNRDLLARRLERAGYAVETAAGAAEAMRMIEAGAYELVLLDNMMPEVSGLDMLRLLRATRAASELPVIMVTALNESERVVEALGLGANDYVTKPIDFPVALARIKTQLDRRQADHKLRQSEERYSLAARGSNDGLWDWDVRAGSVFYSPRWKEMLGCADLEVSDSPDEWLSRLHPEDRQGLLEQLASHRSPGGPGDFVHEHRMMHRDGSYRWMLSRAVVQRNPDGTAIRMTGSVTDITRTKAFDVLTGLPNRALFQETVARQFRQWQQGESPGFAVLFIGLDRFKVVNESLGHLAGDRLLVEVGRRLRASVRARGLRNDDFVARLGGDEFAVLVAHGAPGSMAAQVAARLVEILREPVRLEGREVLTGASIGIVESSPGYAGSAEMLRDADTAMSRAKALGKGRAVLFEPAMRQMAVERMQLESDLKRAVERGEFRLFYQPKVDMTTLRLVGFEALIRWEHPELGLLAPDRFITLAEETGMIVALGEWVLREACAKTKEWQDLYPLQPPLEISVNLSVHQLRQLDLPGQVGRAINDSGIAASTLQLEITESVLIQDFDDAGQVCGGLKKLGVGLKIDDFGTGYSSLNYLTRLPFDWLKIDRSFVNEMCAADGQATEVVRTIVELAKNLGMQVVAEGVETAEQMERLKAMGCSFGQGFYFSRPVPAEEAGVLVHQQAEAGRISGLRWLVPNGTADSAPPTDPVRSPR